MPMYRTRAIATSYVINNKDSMRVQRYGFSMCEPTAEAMRRETVASRRRRAEVDRMLDASKKYITSGNKTVE